MTEPYAEQPVAAAPETAATAFDAPAFDSPALEGPTPFPSLSNIMPGNLQHPPDQHGFHGVGGGA